MVPDLAPTVLLQTTAGIFFAISGYHKLFNKERHESLVETLKELHIPYVKFNQWWVPFWEFTAGVGLAFSIGIAAKIFAAILLIICIVALCADGPRRVNGYQPIDFADKIDDYLYLPETLLTVMLVAIILIA